MNDPNQTGPLPNGSTFTANAFFALSQRQQAAQRKLQLHHRYLQRRHFELRGHGVQYKHRLSHYLLARYQLHMVACDGLTAKTTQPAQARLRCSIPATSASITATPTRTCPTASPSSRWCSLPGMSMARSVISSMTSSSRRHSRPRAACRIRPASALQIPSCITTGRQPKLHSFTSSFNGSSGAYRVPASSATPTRSENLDRRYAGLKEARRARAL